MVVVVVVIRIEAVFFFSHYSGTCHLFAKIQAYALIIRVFIYPPSAIYSFNRARAIYYYEYKLSSNSLTWPSWLRQLKRVMHNSVGFRGCVYLLYHIIIIKKKNSELFFCGEFA